MHYTVCCRVRDTSNRGLSICIISGSKSSKRTKRFGTAWPGATTKGNVDVTSTSPVLEGLLFRYRLAHGAFESCCRSSVFVLLRLVTVVRPWCTYSFGRLNLLDSLLRHTYAMAEVYLDFGIQQMNNPFYYSLTRRSWVKLPTAPGSKDDRYPGIGAS